MSEFLEDSGITRERCDWISVAIRILSWILDCETETQLCSPGGSAIVGGGLRSGIAFGSITASTSVCTVEVICFDIIGCYR